MRPKYRKQSKESMILAGRRAMPPPHKGHGFFACPILLDMQPSQDENTRNASQEEQRRFKESLGMSNESMNLRHVQCPTGPEEHNMDFIMKRCDPVIAMAEGKVIFEGTPAEAQSNPLLLEAYLGAAIND